MAAAPCPSIARSRSSALRSVALALRLLVAAALLLGGACGEGSCVQFDAQSLRLRFDAARDRLDALLVYRDLTASGSDVTGAVQQFEKARGGRIIALVENFPAL